MLMKAFQLIFAFIGGSAAIYAGAKNGYIIGASGIFFAYICTLAITRLTGYPEESEAWDDIPAD
jgi:hypothetical protein